MAATLEIGKLYYFLGENNSYLYPNEFVEDEDGGFLIYAHSLVTCVKCGTWTIRDGTCYNQYLLLVVKTQELGWFTDCEDELEDLFEEIPT